MALLTILGCAPGSGFVREGSAVQRSDADTPVTSLARPAGLGSVVLVPPATVVSAPHGAWRDGVLPGDVTVGGAFRLVADAFRPKADVPPSRDLLSLALMCAGSALACWAIARLWKRIRQPFLKYAAYA